MEEDKDGVGRVMEIAQLAKLFLSLFDSLRERKFSKQQSLEVADRFIMASMNYKADLDFIESQENDGTIIFMPEDGHEPGCQNA